MPATTRRSRNYKGKSSMFALGYFALPLAAVLALGLLFFGIKFFFLAPPDRTAAIVPSAPVAVAPEAEVELEPIQMNMQWDDLAGTIDDTPQEEAVIGVTDQAPPTPAPLPEERVALAGPIGGTGVAARQPGNVERTASRAETRPSRAETQKPAASSAASDSKWAVQVGAFVNQSGATAMAEQVRKLGYKATVSRSDASGKTYHRVRVIAGDNRESANRLAAELERKGYPVAVVPAR
jgi:DedD protein